LTPSTSEATSAVTAVGILDTSVVIELPNLSAADLPEFPTISVITLAELSVGSEVSKNSHERAMRQLVLQQTEASFDPLPFDALIAATALAHNLPLYTRNVQDFEGIDGLDLRPVTPNI